MLKMPGPRNPAAAHASLPISTCQRTAPRRRPRVRVTLPRRREGLYSHCRGAPQELFRAILIS
jgi:hypothetical protein